MYFLLLNDDQLSHFVDTSISFAGIVPMSFYQLWLTICPGTIRYWHSKVYYKEWHVGTPSKCFKLWIPIRTISSKRRWKCYIYFRKLQTNSLVGRSDFSEGSRTSLWLDVLFLRHWTIMKAETDLWWSSLKWSSRVGMELPKIKAAHTSCDLRPCLIGGGYSSGHIPLCHHLSLASRTMRLSVLQFWIDQSGLKSYNQGRIVGISSLVNFCRE